jgi:hypothetical protein
MLMNNTQNQRVFYERLPNGRYRAVSLWDSDLLDSFRVGYTLVTVNRRNGTVQSRRTLATADHVAIAAAAESLRDRLAEIVLKSSEIRPSLKEPITEQQQQLWDQLKATGISSVHWPSVQDTVDQILKAIADHAQKATDVPWVAEARERYQTAVSLALAQDHE